MPKTDDTTERNIRSLTEIRNKLSHASGSLTCYDDLYQKYGSLLQELHCDLEKRLGAFLLRKHDDENPPHLTK